MSNFLNFVEHLNKSSSTISSVACSNISRLIILFCQFLNVDCIQSIRSPSETDV